MPKAHKNKGLPSVRYAYGVPLNRRALEGIGQSNGEFYNERLCLQQLHKARRYFNTLMAIEVHRREVLDQLEQAEAHEVKALLEQQKTLTDQIEEKVANLKAQRAAARKRIRDPQVTEEIKELKAQRKLVYEQVRDQRLLFKTRPDIVAARDQIHAETHRLALAARKDVRREPGSLFWGTYLRVEAAIEAAVKARELGFRKWPNARGPAGNDLPPQRDRIEGTLAIQLQKPGVTPQQAFSGKHPRLRIKPVDPRAYDDLTVPLGERKRLQRTVMELQIGGLRKNVIRAKFPIILHRPLPPDAKIMWVELIRRLVADKPVWSVQFVLSRASGWRKTATGKGEAGLDVGYRRVGEPIPGVERFPEYAASGGLRVAYCVGDYDPHTDKGHDEELVLPDKLLRQYATHPHLRSIRDKNRDTLLVQLGSWLDAQSQPLPAWLEEAVRGTPEHPTHVRQWRSPLRLHRLEWAWAANRFAGDAEIFEQLCAYYHQDRHLWQWQQNVSRSVVYWRLDLYRKFAARLSRQYKRVYIEKLDLARMARRLPPEEGAKDQALVTFRSVAANATLLQVLKESGMEVVPRPPQRTTQVCRLCDHVNYYPEPQLLMVPCENCGAIYDQDRNAAVNLLRGLPEEELEPDMEPVLA